MNKGQEDTKLQSGPQIYTADIEQRNDNTT